MKYQLVLQFPERLYGDLDWIAAFEDYLESYLDEAIVDGHDMGSGEVNIFIHTDNAVETFQQLKEVLNVNDYLKNVKAAYRELSEESYICLWPVNLREFKIV